MVLLSCYREGGPDMTPDRDEGITLGADFLEEIINNGTGMMRQVFEKLFNETMKIERNQFLGAGLHERNPERIGHANGYKPKSINTKAGTLELAIPQVRGLGFYPASIERGCRSEKALKLAIAEMYIQGVSTRRVSKITEARCGTEISSTQVSRMSVVIDDELKKFRERPLARFPYVFLDARYEKVRRDGCLQDAAVLIAIGVNPSGNSEVLGVSIAISEAEPHWRKFLTSLQKRGLMGLELVISDDHVGLKKARRAVFPSVKWQRCQFHMSQNAQSHAPTMAMRIEVGCAMRDIFSQATKDDAITMKNRMVSKFAKRAPAFARWLEENIEEGLTIYSFPRAHWRRLRTSNFLERVNREIKRRTRVAGIFPSEASVLRLVSAVLLEIHEEWAVQRIYLNMKPGDETRAES